jgi:predicted acyl esterase
VITAGLRLASGQSAGGGPRGAPATSRPILAEKNVEARMRDGVVLRADVYRPETPERLPAHIWAASSATDTDFTVKLVDVLPDGTARMLTDGILRARYRAGKTKPQLLTPGRAEELTIEVGATSNVVAAGHRIRIEISSSNFPRFDRNPNTGAAFGRDAELRRAEQTVFHDARRASRIVLPVVPR